MKKVFETELRNVEAGALISSLIGFRFGRGFGRGLGFGGNIFGAFRTLTGFVIGLGLFVGLLDLFEDDTKELVMEDHKEDYKEAHAQVD